MKLYGTIVSERDNQRGEAIKKGHGGNEFVRVDFELNRVGRVATVILELRKDGMLVLNSSAWKDGHCTAEHEFIIEGEKQKGEVMQCMCTQRGNKCMLHANK